MRVNRVKYFKAEYDWKWQHNNHEDRLHITINDNEYDLCEHFKTDLRRTVFKHT